jgi:thiol-disulfide isomerase/thioredoxin
LDGERQMNQNVRRLAIIFAGIMIPAMAGFWSVGYLLSSQMAKTPPVADGAPLGTPDASITKLIRLREPRVVAGLAFTDADGAPKTLADWRGKVILVNLWATWCVPCREELPSLDRLQAKLGGKNFSVVAISLDRTGADAPKRFLDSTKLTHLQLFLDPKGEATAKLTAQGLPTSLLIDREGREVARLAGAAEWDGPALSGVIQALIEGR